MGAAQSANWIGSIMPLACSHSNSLSTCDCKAYGTEQALQKRGGASGLMTIFAL